MSFISERLRHHLGLAPAPVRENMRLRCFEYALLMAHGCVSACGARPTPAARAYPAHRELRLPGLWKISPLDLSARELPSTSARGFRAFCSSWAQRRGLFQTTAQLQVHFKLPTWTLNVRYDPFSLGGNVPPPHRSQCCCPLLPRVAPPISRSSRCPRRE